MGSPAYRDEGSFANPALDVRCIYCPSKTTAKKKYHIAPHAAGNTPKDRFPLEEILLPKGLACDECNLYFGQKIEPGIANHPYVQQWRAVYSMRSRKGRPVYHDEEVAIATHNAGLLDVRGARIELSREGHLQVPRPSLDHVDHIQVSRAVHKIALEYELQEIVKGAGLEAARQAARERPLSIVVDYVRRGHHSTYRPYGVECGGATRVSIAPWRSNPDPHGVIVGPPAFTGYIVGLPGARFSCTLAEDPSMLCYMLAEIAKTEVSRYLTTRKVYWTPSSGGIVVV
jgi:hypothetical protein